MKDTPIFRALLIERLWSPFEAYAQLGGERDADEG